MLASPWIHFVIQLWERGVIPGALALVVIVALVIHGMSE